MNCVASKFSTPCASRGPNSCARSNVAPANFALLWKVAAPNSASRWKAASLKKASPWKVAPVNPALPWKVAPPMA